MKESPIKVLVDLLVLSGYAVSGQEIKDGRKVDHYRVVITDNKDFHKQVTERFEPVADTLKGLHQFHRLEIYFEGGGGSLKAHQLWLNSSTIIEGAGHKKRIKRMMWVAGELAKTDKH